MFKRIYLIFLCGWLLINHCNCVGSDDEDQATGGRLSAQTSMRFVASQPTLSLPEEDFDIVHPCTDFGFKRAFHDEIVLSGFLNSLWNLQGNDIIVGIQYLDAGLPSDDWIGRHFTVDIRCKTKAGEHYLIEMQNDYHGNYTDKAHVEHCRMIGRIDTTSTMNVEDEDREMMSASSTCDEAKSFWRSISAVRTVVITNKSQTSTRRKQHFEEELTAEPEIVNTYSMRHDEHLERHLGDIKSTVTLVMLDLFKKGEEELSTDLDRWLFALKDVRLRTGKDKIPKYKHVHPTERMTANREPLLRFYTKLNKSGIGRDLLSEYEEAIDQVNAILERREARARAEGKAEGEVTGRTAEKKEMISKILRRGKMTEEEIAEDAEVDISVVKQIKLGLESEAMRDE